MLATLITGILCFGHESISDSSKSQSHAGSGWSQIPTLAREQSWYIIVGESLVFLSNFVKWETSVWWHLINLWHSPGSLGSTLRLGNLVCCRLYGCAFIIKFQLSEDTQMMNKELRNPDLRADYRCHHRVPYIFGFNYFFSSWVLDKYLKNACMKQ